MKEYKNEVDGQREFYSRIGANPDLSHNTDGVDGGNLYENKLFISNINKVLFQAIKYASRIRIRGEKLPANLVLNDLNRETAYIFKSKDFLKDIEKIYFGGASKNNEDYSTDKKPITIIYDNKKGLKELLEILDKEEYVKYSVDKNNILGLSQQFYKVNQNKDKFLKGEDAEIRVPNVLADRIIPYKKKDNMEFEDIMDCLNPNLLQREQGAFYTPTAYVKRMHKILYKIIEEIKAKGRDYIIIDRCAGTGNLEEGLTDEVLSHCVLSTIEFNEYVILNYKYGDKCLVVIPNTDALSYDIIPAEHNEQGVSNDFIRERIKDKNCSVILLENPPYSEVAAGSLQNAGIKKNPWKNTYVMQEMKKEKKGSVTNELGNLFIWSGFKYYLRDELDFFILYSPTKYWRYQNLVNKKFVDGFLCNRKHFHASPSSIGCIAWQNVDDFKTETLTLPAYDIENDEVKEVEDCKEITIKKVHRLLSENYDLRTSIYSPFLSLASL